MEITKELSNEDAKEIGRAVSQDQFRHAFKAGKDQVQCGNHLKVLYYAALSTLASISVNTFIKERGPVKNIVSAEFTAIKDGIAKDLDAASNEEWEAFINDELELTKFPSEAPPA